MAVRQYIGARYVTKVYENSQDPSSAEWEPGVTWDPLIIVTYQNGSYMSKKPIPGNIGNPPANPEYWTQTGFYNGQIASLQEQISDINLELHGIHDDIEDNAEDITAIQRNSRELKGNLLLNEIYQYTDGAPNGACYIGNDRVVVYYSKSGSNTGVLTCYNLSTFTKVWSNSINGYHGNSVTYNPENNNLYICGCMDNTNNNRINAILEIDADAPSVVIREITLPDITECYSLIYDKDSHKFYATPYVGTTPGSSNIMCVFNETLDELLETKTLPIYPATTYQLSTQGVQMVKDGVAYVISYSMTCQALWGYDTTTGELVTTAMLPRFINTCRGVGEPETLFYDYDNDRVIMESLFMTTGIANYWVMNLFEIDLFKGIPVFSFVADNEVYGVDDNNRYLQLWCVIAADTLKPSWLIATNFVTVPNDALIYSRLINKGIHLFIKQTLNGLTERTYTLAGLQLNNFTGWIQGDSNTHKVEIVNCRIDSFSNVCFYFCDFNGFNPTTGLWCNVYMDSQTHVYFQQCNFQNWTGGATSERFHIVGVHFVQGYAYNCTFNGSVSNNKLANLGSTITIA